MWKFHRLCGKNIYLDNNSTTAKRLNQTKENYYGVVVTNQPLVNGEVFEIQIDKGGGGLFDSVALGVTGTLPENLENVTNATNLKDSWILHGPFLRKNGEQSVKLYPLNLFNVKVGDKLGIWKASDRTLHFHLNGNDQGIASSNLPEDIYGVVDLQGHCCEISITNTESARESGAQVAIKKASYFSGRPADWNVNTVCDFIESIPDCALYSEKFRSEHIDGAALVELDKKDLKEFFEMPLGLAVKICSHLKKLEEKK